MAIDVNPSAVATRALQALPFSTLIGGPLNACIQAQAQAAQTSWRFIQEVGLNSNTGEAVNVTFLYQKDGQMVKLCVPLLTIVTIPYIAIDECTINFKANISASSSSVQESTTSSTSNVGTEVSAGVRLGLFNTNTSLKANYSSKKDSKASEDSKYSVEYTMDVYVSARQSDMPAGMAAVLNILQSSINEADPNGVLLVSPAQPQIRVLPSHPDCSQAFVAVVKDGNGRHKEGVEVTFTVPAAEGVIKSITVGDASSAQPASGNSVAVKTNSKGEAAVKVAFVVDYGALKSSEEIAVAMTGTVDGRDLKETVRIVVNK